MSSDIVIGIRDHAPYAGIEKRDKDHTMTYRTVIIGMIRGA